MTKHFFYRNILTTILSLASFIGAAQNKTTVKVSVDKNRILIGERFNLTVETTIPVKETFPSWSIDNIPHFEIIAKEKIDTARSEHTITILQRIQLTSFDSGHWYIPSFNFGKRIRTDSIAVDVIFSDFDPQKPYHDVKEIIEVNAKEKEQWWPYLVVGSMLVIGLIIWLLTRKKKAVVIESKPVDPFKEAMLQLDKLEKQNIPLPQYYTELVNIFRLYVFQKKEIQSLQKTTDDLILQLRDINLNREQFGKLSEALRLSDAVKFAKYIPSQEDTKTAFKNIKDSIQAIEQLK